LGESNPYFIPFFQVSRFSCFSPDFVGVVSARWRMNLAKPKEVFVQKFPYTIKSSILCTGVTTEGEKMSEHTPIFSRFGQILSSNIFGIYLLFLARRIEFNLLSLRIVFVIYIYVCNRLKKGLN
jgi:hypothetical protein